MLLEDVFTSIMLFLPELVKGVVALVIIVDPFGNIPIFISLTKNMDEQQRSKTFRTAVLTGLILLFAFTVAGQQILFLFGISIYSFMVAGGILLLIVAIKLQETGNWREEIVSSESIGAVPIGCPLLVGPGAITNTILSLQSAGATVTILSVLITFLIVWLVLRFVNPLYRILGKTGSLVITRVMSLLIAAIAVQYIFQGAKHII